MAIEVLHRHPHLTTETPTLLKGVVGRLVVTCATTTNPILSPLQPWVDPPIHSQPVRFLLHHLPPSIKSRIGPNPRTRTVSLDKHRPILSSIDSLIIQARAYLSTRRIRNFNHRCHHNPDGKATSSDQCPHLDKHDEATRLFQATLSMADRNERKEPPTMSGYHLFGWRSRGGQQVTPRPCPVVVVSDSGRQFLGQVHEVELMKIVKKT